MKWFRRIFRAPGQKKDAVWLLNLRCTRFRQLVRNYGRILDALADAAEKQAGDYILDKQYIVTLSEVVIDLTEAIVFDLNVLAGQRYESFYAVLDRFRSEIRQIIADEDQTAPRREGGAEATAVAGSAASPATSGTLAGAIAGSRTLYQHVGQVACRGVAAGAVFNLETEDRPDAFPQGAVMVASDILPNEELIRVMKRASAILTDHGEPAGDTATLAREFRIPTIVGLHDASGRLETGTEVTVDADENTVYLGRIEELLEYYRTERLDEEEEAEYRILRRLRRLMFPLTLGEGGESGAELGDCKTLHDLVHLAHELAGESQMALVASLRDLRTSSAKLATGLEIPIYVIDVGEGLERDDAYVGGPDIGQVRSIPLRAFLTGIEPVLRQASRARQPGFVPAEVIATVTEDHANIMVEQPRGFDIVDSMIGESKESNHIYCRFASTVRGSGGEAERSAVAREILLRLDFGAARTARGTAAWFSGVPRTEMEERLAIVGRLGASLLETDATGWDDVSRGAYVEEFIARHV
jgi:pyruvate,water dikinase